MSREPEAKSRTTPTSIIRDKNKITHIDNIRSRCVGCGPIGMGSELGVEDVR